MKGEPELKASRLLIATILGIVLIANVVTEVQLTSKDLSFTESKSISGFPVPTEAIISITNNLDIRFIHTASYQYENIGGEQGLYPEEEYLKEIEQWGWLENKEERMGHKYQFEKDGREVWFIIHEDRFSVLELAVLP